MSKASLGQSECESTVGDANQPVEPYIPTYAEMIRREYGDELHTNIYMHTERDLEEARDTLGELAEILSNERYPAQDIKALYTARACVMAEIKRRNHDETIY